MARCSRPDEEIVPYVEMPERMAAGEIERYATTLPLSGYGRGFLALAVDGRPIKIEGNPRHPFSLGATDVFAEAEVLSLYDPDRSRVVLRDGQVSDWPSFEAAWRQTADTLASRPGDTLALVTGRIVSPTTLARIEALKKLFPQTRWYRYEPVNDDHARAGARQVFGKAATVLPRLADADVVLALGGRSARARGRSNCATRAHSRRGAARCGGSAFWSPKPHCR